MNERIQELIEQCTSLSEGSTWTSREEFDKEKFAELIVQECMACSTWVGTVNKHPGEPIHIAMAINKRITQQLGVK